MTPFHWTLATIAALLLLALAGLLVYDVLAMQNNWPTISYYGHRLQKPWVFILGLAWGLALGFIAGHLWFPLHKIDPDETRIEAKE